MFRFSIRDVLWLILVAGIALAWFQDRHRIDLAVEDLKLAIREQESAKQQLEVKQAEYEKRYQELSNPRSYIWSRLSKTPRTQTGPQGEEQVPTDADR